MKTTLDFTKSIILLIVGFIIFINCDTKPWRHEGRVVKWDIISYYAYLPAGIIYHDLSLEFTKKDSDFFKNKFWPNQTPDGKKVIKTSMGLAILYLPFFLLSHLIVLIGGFAAPTGFSTPYLFLLQFSSLFYLTLALLILRKVLLRWYSQVAVGLVLLATVLGTNLLHYTTLEAPMSHTYSLFLFVMLLWLTIKYWDKPTIGNTLAVGLLLGLISLVRPSNLVVALVFILWSVSRLSDLKERFLFFLRNWHYSILIGLCGVLVWLPQMLYWKAITGNWFYNSYSGEGFFFLKPSIVNGLFSYRKGWLVYTPIMILPLIGFIRLYISDKRQFIPLFTFTVINIYIIFSWWVWWYGGSFGQRALIESYAFLTIPFAALIDWSLKSRGRLKSALVLITILLTMHGIFQNFQYRYGTIHWESMSKRAYWATFLHLKPVGNMALLLEHPDYGLAKQGKDGIIPRPNYVEKPIAEAILCDCETPSRDGTKLLSTDQRIEFEGGYRVSTEESRSGKFSVMVKSGMEFGLTYRFMADTGKTYRASVWRKGDRQANLVVSATNPNDFYLSSNQPIAIDSNGWERIEIEFKAHPDIAKKGFLIYVWNPNKGKAFFDDIQLGIAK